MQTKAYNIYTYNELDEKAKEKAREWYTNGNDYTMLTEYMGEHAKYLLETAGFDGLDIKNVYASLSYCQGDGAMVEFTGIYTKLNIKYAVSCKQAGNYCHYNSTSYDISDDNGDDAIPEVYEHVESVCVGVFQELEKFGYSLIEYENSEENVAEVITINEYTFLSDGTRHN